MNCQAIQNKILHLPDPRVMPESLRAHVAGCAGCKAWAAQAARLESLLEELPAPAAPADKKDTLIAGLVGGGPIITRPPAVPARGRPLGVRVGEFVQRNAALIGGLAAAVLIAWGVWSLIPKGGSKPEVAALPDDPFLRKIVQRDVELANAKNPAERLRVLTTLADDLSAQTRTLARVASAEELKELARLYDRVVKMAALTQAETINAKTNRDADEREALETLARRLGATATEADKLMGEVPADAKPAIQTIAESAGDAHKKLLPFVELRGEGKKGD